MMNLSSLFKAQIVLLFAAVAAISLFFGSPVYIAVGTLLVFLTIAVLLIIKSINDVATFNRTII